MGKLNSRQELDRSVSCLSVLVLVVPKCQELEDVDRREDGACLYDIV